MPEKIKPIYFCFGDFRTGEKKYRIFKVQNVQDAYNVADELGLEIILDNTRKDNTIANPTMRTIISILDTIHCHFHKIENVVSCSRVERGEAERMKRHFNSTDMTEYFPKLLEENIEVVLPDGRTVYKTRRDHPWITDFWTNRFHKSPPAVIRIHAISPDEELIHAAAVREKNRRSRYPCMV